MESGMKQFQQDVKEIREVLSAEITARRNGNDKVIKRVEDVELKEESALSELTELLGTQVRLHAFCNCIRRRPLRHNFS